jgi:hypothetical protein
MKHKKLDFALIASALTFSFLGWHAVDQAITVAGASVWLMPTIWFSLFFISLSLAIVLIREKHISDFLALSCFALSFIFAFDFSGIAILILAFLLVSLGIIRIKRDLDLNIRIDIGKSIYAGKAFIVTSLAIVIAGQYYATVKDMDASVLIPKIDFGKESNSITSSIFAAMNPQFKSIQNSSLTVDEFIIQTQNEQINSDDFSEKASTQIDEIIEEQGGENLTAAQKLALKQDALKQINASKNKVSKANEDLVLQEGREKLSELAGKKLTGEEKISDVFSEMVNNKIMSYFQPVESDGLVAGFLPFIFSLILLLTIIPIANFLWLFFPTLIGWIFRLLVKTKAVKIGTITREVEVIE